MSSVGKGPGGTVEIAGHLSETPLFVVVRRIQRERRSGTLSVLRGDQVRQLVFENGELYAARSSREEHRIGATLVRWGYVSEEDLAAALERQKETHERIDVILVERGLVTRAIVDSEARRQMEQIVFSTLSWPEGSFHFEANTGSVELDVTTSLSQEMIIEGIRRIPESEQFMELLGDLSGVPTLTRDPMSSGSLKLLRDAVGMIASIDGRLTLKDLVESSSIPGTASAKILYSLLFAGLIEVRPAGTLPPPAPTDRRKAARPEPDRRTEDRRAADRRPGGGPSDRKPGGYLFDLRLDERPGRATDDGVPADASGSAAAPKGVFRTPRELVLDMYRQLDWLSHYDLLGVSRRAPAAEIEQAYRDRSRLFDPSLKAHPELVDCWRQLTVLAKWLRVAYGVLSKPESREAYDRTIADAADSPPPDPR